MYMLKVSYRTIDPDDAESGEYSDEGWENEEGTEYDGIEELYQAIREYMPFDSASYNLSERRLTLYGADAGIELATGTHTYHDCHVENVQLPDVDVLMGRLGIRTGF